MRTILFFLVLIAASPLRAQEPCEGQLACQLGERSYHVLLPDGWDGQTPMPVLLHFHGWMRQGTLIVRHGRIAGATRTRGVLLLAPNGRGKSWDFWRADTPDIGFARDVLADAARRWPIDPDRIHVSGYSYGSAMAWRFACAEGDRIAALLAISGTLRDQGEACATGPVEVRHVHGLSDTVMDYPFGPGGDVDWPVKLWRDINGCATAPDRVEAWEARSWLPFERHVWEDCTGGKAVRLDIHKGGHVIPRGWIARQLDELLDLPQG